MDGLPLLSYDADRYVGITGVCLSRFASRLGAAFGALRVESATFYGIIASAAFCRRPLPAVSPEVDAAACAFGQLLVTSRMTEVCSRPTYVVNIALKFFIFGN